MKTSLLISLLCSLAATLPAVAETPADLNDLQMAHVGYVADNLDIQYGHLALALSTTPAVREFATTMISDIFCAIMSPPGSLRPASSPIKRSVCSIHWPALSP